MNIFNNGSEMDDELLNVTSNHNNTIVTNNEAWEISRDYLLAAFFIECFFAVIGIFGNVIVCIVIVCSKSMHTVPNCYLFSLSISDLMLLHSKPLLHLDYLYADIGHKIFNLPLKIFTYWMSTTSQYVSIATITAFTIERYLAVCHPFYIHGKSGKSRTIKLLSLLWTFGSLYSSIDTSYLYFVDRNPTHAFSVFMKSIRIYLQYGSAVVFFLLPLIIILIMYILIGYTMATRRRKFGKGLKTTQDADQKAAFIMMVVIVVPVSIAWLALLIGRIPNVLLILHKSVAIFLLKVENFSFLLLCGYALLSVSSAANPIVYSFVSTKFRRAVKEVLFERCTRYSSRVQRDSNSTATATIEMTDPVIGSKIKV